MFAWLRRFSSTLQSTNSTQPTNPHLRLDVESLEDRTTPTVSAITANFNGVAIPAGDSLWFSSVAQVSHVPTSGATIHVTDQTISFTAKGTQYSFHVADTTLVLSPTAKQAEVTTNAAGDWVVTEPTKFGGQVFLSGLSVQLPNGLPGDVKNVTWSGDFTTDTAGVKVDWQWEAAAYKQLGANNADLGVKPTDMPTPTYHNGNAAGTPENFKTHVVAGARGHGRGDYTGDGTHPARVVPSVASTQQLASLAGVVTNNGVAQANVTVTLTGMTSQGQSVNLTVTTGSDGTFSFANLQPGNYTITETPPSASSGSFYLGTTASSGQINGQTTSDTASGASISGITLASGGVGTGFNFNNQYGLPQ